MKGDYPLSSISSRVETKEPALTVDVPPITRHSLFSNGTGQRRLALIDPTRLNSSGSSNVATPTRQPAGHVPGPVRKLDQDERGALDVSNELQAKDEGARWSKVWEFFCQMWRTRTTASNFLASTLAP